MSFHTLWKWQPSAPDTGKRSDTSPYRAEQPGEPDNLSEDELYTSQLDDISVQEALDDMDDIFPVFDPTILVVMAEESNVVKYEHTCRFADWFSFVKQAEMGKSILPDNQRDSRNTDRSDWYGASWEEALYLAKVGWQDGAKKIQLKMDLINTHIPAKRLVNELHMEQAGPGTIDMDRLRMGHPEPWIVWKPEEKQVDGDKIVRIVFNASASAMVDTDAIFDKGALVVTLIDLLERSGKRVELVWAESSGYSDYGITTIVQLKNASDILDIDKLAYALCHPSALRRLQFSIMEQAPKQYLQKCGVPGGYGTPRTYKEDVLTIPSNAMPNSPMLQLKWLRESLLVQGIEIDID